MIACFDTSAIVPLLVDEPASASCERVWRDATRVHIASITIAETAAALAQARRLDRIDDRALQTALRGAGQLWQRCALSTVTVALAREAAELAVLHDLRGFDAVQCAFGMALAEAGAIGVAGDRDLLSAWRTAGMPVLDITR